MRSRKTSWLTDERILTLDLYFKEGKRADLQMRQELSNLLRAIPIEKELAQDPSFRSEKAVSQKLHNFVHLDPSDPTDGFPNVGQGDRDVWEIYSSDPEGLAITAAKIREVILGASPSDSQDLDESEDMEEAPEGALLSRQHRYRERNSKLVAKKKKQVLTKTGNLACEACGFTFSSSYGERGDGFIECHHSIPISQLQPGHKTKLSELRLVCSNCHRMIHRRAPWITVEELAAILSSQES